MPWAVSMPSGTYVPNQDTTKAAPPVFEGEVKKNNAAEKEEEAPPSPLKEEFQDAASMK